MIYIAIIIQVLSTLTPKWILKSKYSKLQDNFSWKISVLKLSGLATSFLVSFLIIASLTLTKKDRYVLNENAIYGLNYSPLMKDYGFIDGDKIISINSNKVDRISKIFAQILYTSGDINIEIKRDEKLQNIIIPQSDLRTLIQNPSSDHFSPKMQPDSIDYSANQKEVLISETPYGLSDVLKKYSDMWRHVTLLFSPKQEVVSQVGGYIAFSGIKNISGYFLILSLSLLFIGLINLLPLPGFSVGNTIISIIENVRKKRFNLKKLNWIKGLSVCGLIILILIKVYL